MLDKYIKDDFSGVFGMTEMELATESIIERIRNYTHWNASFSIESFSHNENLRIGFVELVYYDYLIKEAPFQEVKSINVEAHYANGVFAMSEKFIDKITKVPLEEIKTEMKIERS